MPEPEAIKNLIKNSGLFSGLDEREAGELAAVATISRYTPGSRIFTQGESADVLYLVQSGEVDVLILSERIGYAGLDLWRANQAIFVSTDYPAGTRENAEKRCHRIGSEIHEAVTYYDLVVEDSMDWVVIHAIREKLNMSREILKHIRKE